MVTAYPVAGKQKCLDICHAFVAGCGGTIAKEYREGPAFFYGVDDSNAAAWKRVVETGGPFYYADNSYFDQTRQQYFRVTKNALQHCGTGKSDGARFFGLNIPVAPWSDNQGETIVLCPQSQSFMHRMARVEFWTERTLDEIRKHTGRRTVVREWSGNKGKLAKSLAESIDAREVYAVVTHSSSAAITALMNGIPAVCTGPSAARPMCGKIEEIESLPKRQRYDWAGILADNQFTLAEMSSGLAWKMLNGGGGITTEPKEAKHP